MYIVHSKCNTVVSFFTSYICFFVEFTLCFIFAYNVDVGKRPNNRVKSFTIANHARYGFARFLSVPQIKNKSKLGHAFRHASCRFYRFRRASRDRIERVRVTPQTQYGLRVCIICSARVLRTPPPQPCTESVNNSRHVTETPLAKR